MAHAILEDEDSPFAVRALTRNPDSEAAQELAAKGAEVVHADLDDPESLVPAFQGAHGAFCVTNFWEHFSPAREQAQVKNMAAAAKEAGVSHVVWSTLEDTRKWVPLDDDRMPTLLGEFKVPHFDGKGASDIHFEEAGVPTTYLLSSFYWDNLIHFGMGPQRAEDGSLALNLPMGDRKLPGIAARDIGRSAYGIFKAGGEHVGRKVGIAGEHLTGEEMARTLSEALGEPVRYNAVPFEVYRSLGFDGADDLGNMFQFKHDFEDYFCSARPVEGTRALNPDLQTFKEWVSAHRDRISAG